MNAQRTDNVELLERHLRSQAQAHAERAANFDGDTSVEGMVQQEMLLTYSRLLATFADEAATARGAA